MANILDYMDWRGDLTFEQSPFNEIDALILCQISYLNFDGILENDNFSKSLPLSRLSDLFMNSSDFKTRSDMGMLINQNTSKVLEAAGKCNRFKDVEITGYVSIIDLSKEEQFSASTFKILPKVNFVAYRGTDDTIVGFKEDFNLAIMDVVPAQEDAVKYLEKASSLLKGEFYIGGHSKGGNLAVYAGAMCKKDVKQKVQVIYNMDGPGFQEKRLQSQEFYEIIPKIQSFYPHFSIVGMIFNHAGNYSVVESEQTGIMQHDPFSWHLHGKAFILEDSFDETSSFFNETLNTWLMSLSQEQQAQFIETLFKILQVTEAQTNSEIESNFFENSVKIIKAWRDTDSEIRDQVENTIRMLFKIAHKQLPLAASDWFEKHAPKVAFKKKDEGQIIKMNGRLAKK